MKGLIVSHALLLFLEGVLALALIVPAGAQVVGQVTEHILTHSDSTWDDGFGASVSLSGDRALVGAATFVFYGVAKNSMALSGDRALVAPAGAGQGSNSGSAYVYERQGDGSWLEVDKLTASDGATDDLFGISVSLSGDHALVGALWDDDLGDMSGSAYVFERQGDGSWLEVAKLIASDGAGNDRFGGSVSLSGGTRALVGAFFHDDLGMNSGSAYVYERQGDGSWLEVFKLNASDGAGDDRFGGSVSLSGDRALVGASGDDDMGDKSGSAYVYERQGDGSWLEVAKLTASDGATEDFFSSVSLSGDRALVGAPGDDDLGTSSGSAYVLERQGDGSWREVAKLTASDGAAFDFFGRSVTLSGGGRALVGATGDDGYRGSAYVFERQGDGSWREVFKLTASDGYAFQDFGDSVSLSANRALVGAFIGDDLGGYTGSAYVFENLIIPIELLSFGAIVDGQSVTLSWETASENNNAGFEVQMIQRESWETLSFVEGHGTTTEAQQYSYSLDLLPGSYTFRLKQIDYDGQFELFGNVEATVGTPGTHLLSQVYPNPFNPQVQFTLSAEQTQQVRIDVYNTLGQRVGVLHEGLLPGRGTHHFTFDAGSLPSGVYLLRVTGETFAATRTMTLLK